METIKKILADIRPEFDFESSTDFIEDGYLDSFDLSLKAVLLIKYINKAAFGWKFKKS